MADDFNRKNAALANRSVRSAASFLASAGGDVDKALKMAKTALRVKRSLAKR